MIRKRTKIVLVAIAASAAIFGTVASAPMASASKICGPIAPTHNSQTFRTSTSPNAWWWC